jgi:hypothetical protein
VLNSGSIDDLTAMSTDKVMSFCKLLKLRLFCKFIMLVHLTMDLSLTLTVPTSKHGMKPEMGFVAIKFKLQNK